MKFYVNTISMGLQMIRSYYGMILSALRHIVYTFGVTPDCKSRASKSKKRGGLLAHLRQTAFGKVLFEADILA